jgi:hypothetical protein
VAGPGEQHAGLTEQVERDVGQRHLLLQLWCVADPFGEPVAVDQRIVAEHQAVRRQVGGPHAGWHRGGDLGIEWGEAGPERPSRVALVDLGEAVVDLVATHRCGTSSGIW